MYFMSTVCGRPQGGGGGSGPCGQGGGGQKRDFFVDVINGCKSWIVFRHRIVAKLSSAAEFSALLLLSILKPHILLLVFEQIFSSFDGRPIGTVLYCVCSAMLLVDDKYTHGNLE